MTQWVEGALGAAARRLPPVQRVRAQVAEEPLDGERTVALRHRVRQHGEVAVGDL